MSVNVTVVSGLLTSNIMRLPPHALNTLRGSELTPAVIVCPAPSIVSDFLISCVEVKFEMSAISVTVSPLCAARAMASAKVV